MKTYTVFAVYEDSMDQRYAEFIEASSPEEAERLAIRYADAAIIVAGVVEGKVFPVDQVEESKVTPIRGRGYATNVTRISVENVSIRLPLKCPSCKKDLRKPAAIVQWCYEISHAMGRIPRGETDGENGVWMEASAYIPIDPPPKIPDALIACSLLCHACGHVLWDGYEEAATTAEKKHG